jgi:hypothetical protein
MFRKEVFELQIDYHRRVQEYLRAEAEKAAQRKAILFVSLAILGAGVFAAYKWRKWWF